MDFGVGGGASGNASSKPNFEMSIPKSQGSGVPKTERSDCFQESWRVSKVARPNEFAIFSQDQKTPAFLLRSASGLQPNNGQTMISFSSHSQNPLFGDEDAVKTSAFPFFLSPKDSICPRTSGYATEKLSEGMRGPVAQLRNPFTPSQWMELEHQALIYKHFVANVTVPSHLLIPLKKSFNPYPFSSFSSGSYGSYPLGWGAFHLGFAGSTDPEPGRCRRTDGKKWRCSRDAVPDQKYCERHINRGRHRSRKPVEGQNGQAVSGSTPSKVAPIASSSSASVMSSSSASNSLGAVQHHFKNLQPNDNASLHHLVSGVQELQGLSIVGDSINLKSRDSPFSIQKQRALFGESSQTEFGIVSPDSLLNPSQKSTRTNPKNSDGLLGFNDHETHNGHPLRHFIDNWPKDHQSDRGSISWPEELKSDWTRLSMSIPVGASDFSSSSNSPQQDKPLRLAREIDQIQVGLSLSKELDEPKQKLGNWLPVPWGNTVVGGPLGEVLNNSSSVNNSSSSMNLMTEVWDKSSPQLGMGCSPTGVLQQSTFVSLSKSSSGSSPTTTTTDHKKTPQGVSLCDDMILGSTLANSAAIPSI